MRRFLLLVLPIALMVSACGDGPSNPTGIGSGGGGGGGPLPNGSMSATVNGLAWTASASIVVSNTPASGAIPGILSIAGGDASNRTIGFAFSPVTIGNFTVGAANVNFLLTENPGELWQSAITTTPATTGTLTVTSVTADRAIGTFSFTAVPTAGTGATGTRTVTNGTFNVTF